MQYSWMVRTPAAAACASAAVEQAPGQVEREPLQFVVGVGELVSPDRKTPGAAASASIEVAWPRSSPLTPIAAATLRQSRQRPQPTSSSPLRASELPDPAEAASGRGPVAGADFRSMQPPPAGSILSGCIGRRG